MMKDTDSIDSRDLEVIDQLDNGFSVGVRGITVSYLLKNIFMIRESTEQQLLSLRHFNLNHFLGFV